MSLPAPFLCCLSGVVPVEPCVSATSGLLFERRLVEKALELNGGVCPRTGAPLNKEQLISVKSSLAPGVTAAGGVSSLEVTRPRPPTAASIPALLGMFQGEWDAIVLETHTLKQQLETVKQDLAHALYKEDAAQRVIARLINERDQARAALGETEKNVREAMSKAPVAATAAASSAAPMEVDDSKKSSSSSPLPDSIVTLLSTTAGSLIKSRKGTIKELLKVVATPQQVAALKVGEGHSHPLHSTTNPGILCVEQSKANADLVATGGNDGEGLLFNKNNGKIVARLKGHKSAVNVVKFSPSSSDLLFTGSSDHSSCIWKDDGSGSRYNVVSHLGGNKDSVVALSVHVSGQIVATGCKDGAWALYDTNNGNELARLTAASQLTSPLSQLAFHPDGALLATAGSTDGVVRIFDVKSLSVAATLGEKAHATGVSAFTFAENGFQCVSAEAGGIIKVWDLRKMQSVHTITAVATEGDKAGCHISALSIDDSASYLCAAIGSRVAVYGTKGWEEVVALYGHKDRVTSVAWGSQARTLVSVGLDRNLKLWA